MLSILDSDAQQILPKDSGLSQDNSLRLWYVLETKGGQENSAALNLRQQGFDVFFPQILRTIRHARQTLTRTTPLFPCYVFLNPGSNGRWQPANATVGAKRVLLSGSVPLAAKSGFVEALQVRAGRGGLIDFSRITNRDDDGGMDDEFFDKQIRLLAELDPRRRVFLLMDNLSPVSVSSRNQR